MIEDIELRESRPDDLASIEKLYPAAFPEEDLLPLVRDLLREQAGVLSLVAIVDGALAGHGAFTFCSVDGGAEKVALLGPLAVTPSLQKQGLGGAIIREGFRKLEKLGARRVFVLGDPAYYGRFGFESDERVAPPYPLPEEWRGAWRSLGLGDDGLTFEGALSAPQPWRRRELWAPA